MRVQIANNSNLYYHLITCYNDSTLKLHSLCHRRNLTCKADGGYCICLIISELKIGTTKVEAYKYCYNKVQLTHLVHQTRPGFTIIFSKF